MKVPPNEILTRGAFTISRWSEILGLRPLMAKDFLNEKPMGWGETAHKVMKYQLPHTDADIKAALEFAERSIPKIRKKFWKIITQLGWIKQAA